MGGRAKAGGCWVVVPQVNNFIQRDSHSNVFMMDELVSKKRE